MSHDQKPAVEVIDRLFNAKSIALVGASNDPRKYGYMTLDCIVKGGYQGTIYPINPKGGEILGVTTYRSLAEVPEVPDVAVILLPVGLVPQVLREAAKKGIPGAVITSSGFGEMGRDDLQEELLTIAREENIRIIGPNIEGFIYKPNRLNAQFFPVIKNIGPLATISQSGSLTNGLAEWADAEQLGLCATVNLGNQADICESDFIEYFAQNSHAKAMAFYLEGVKEGRRFIQTLQQEAHKKPVVILKSGRSQAGQKSAASHTASLAGAQDIFRSACRQYGALVVDDLQSLYDSGKALSTMKVPAGNRVLIVSSSGGIGVLAVDEVESCGLQIPELPTEMVKELDELGLSPVANYSSNPIDLAAIWAEEFEKVAMIADRYDIADVFLLNFGDPIVGAGDMVIELSQKVSASLAVAYMGGAEEEKKDWPKMHAAGIPVFPTPERAVRSLNAVVKFGEYQRKRTSQEQVSMSLGPRNHAPQKAPEFLLEPDAVAMVQPYDIPYPQSAFARNSAEAVEMAKRLGFPVVIKIVSPDVPHKSDVGGVAVNLRSAIEVGESADQMVDHIKSAIPNARIEGWQICRQADEGVEVIVGALDDPVFGPTVMFGMGGIFTEVFKDVAFRIAPLRRCDAEEMIREIKGYAILKGSRGRKGVALDKLADCLMAVSQMAVEHPEIGELDLNPVRVYEDRVEALDVRIMKVSFPVTYN